MTPRTVGLEALSGSPARTRPSEAEPASTKDVHTTVEQAMMSKSKKSDSARFSFNSGFQTKKPVKIGSDQRENTAEICAADSLDSQCGSDYGGCLIDGRLVNSQRVQVALGLECGSSIEEGRSTPNQERSSDFEAPAPVSPFSLAQSAQAKSMLQREVLSKLALLRGQVVASHRFEFVVQCVIHFDDLLWQLDAAADCSWRERLMSIEAIRSLAMQMRTILLRVYVRDWASVAQCRFDRRFNLSGLQAVRPHCEHRTTSTRQSLLPYHDSIQPSLHDMGSVPYQLTTPGPSRPPTVAWAAWRASVSAARTRHGLAAAMACAASRSKRRVLAAAAWAALWLRADYGRSTRHACWAAVRRAYRRRRLCAAVHLWERRCATAARRRRIGAQVDAAWRRRRAAAGLMALRLHADAALCGRREAAASEIAAGCAAPAPRIGRWASGGDGRGDPRPGQVAVRHCGGVLGGCSGCGGCGGAERRGRRGRSEATHDGDPESGESGRGPGGAGAVVSPAGRDARTAGRCLRRWAQRCGARRRREVQLLAHALRASRRAAALVMQCGGAQGALGRTPAGD